MNADGHNQHEGDHQQGQGNSDESAEEYESDERTGNENVENIFGSVIEAKGVDVSIQV